VELKLKSLCFLSRLSWKTHPSKLRSRLHLLVDQLAVKKLQIWRLPPVLIVHLKRFQCVNERWIKSHKIVDFPVSGLDPTDYLAAVPAATLRRSD